MLEELQSQLDAFNQVIDYDDMMVLDADGNEVRLGDYASVGHE